MEETATGPVLIGWELGAGRGHLVRLAALTDALLAKGKRVVVAVRDPARAHGLFTCVADRPCASVVQAPIFRHVPMARGIGTSLPEILANIGFADPACLAPVVRGWESLIRNIRPTMVIADTAPGLLLAARGRVPTIAIGSGWAVPPYGTDIPPLPFVQRDGGAAAFATARVMEVAASLRPDARLGTLPSLLRGNWALALTPPALDPYHTYRSDPVYWPLELVTPPGDATADQALIYLPSDHPRTTDALAAAGDFDLAFIAFFGGHVPANVPPNVRVVRAPFDVAHHRPPLFVHHAGLGTTAWALVVGTPQLLLPTDLEKGVTARLLAIAGGGVMANGGHLGRDLDAARQTIVPVFDPIGMATRKAADSLAAIAELIR